MIKKLRRRFISVVAFSLFVVMLVLTAAINGVNYYRTSEKLDEMLEMLCQNAGQVPAFPEEGPAPGGRPRDMSPETAFKTRYFSVTFDENGGITGSNTQNIAAVTPAQARALAGEVYASGKEKGFDGIYKYMAAPQGGGTIVVFLDCSSELDSLRSLFMISCGVALLSLLAVFTLVVLISGRAIRPIAASVEKQKQFITDAEHELKTPITIISSNAEILEMDYGKNEWTDGIRNQVERMRNLVSSMITLSRLDEEQPPMEPARFLFSEAVQDTASAFRGVAGRLGRDLEIAVQPEVWYRGDEAQLRKLVSVLMDNAVKYCDDGGRIEVSLTAGRKICLEVTNSFADAPNLEMDRLFDRFYRADKSRARKSGGSYGLGLSIAKSAVEAHRGKLSAMSRDGVSVTFTVVL